MSEAAPTPAPVVAPPTPAPTPTPVSTPVPAGPTETQKVDGILKRAWAGFLTAITSSAAVTAEKNLAVTVVTGLLVTIGATDGLVQAVQSLISAL